LNYAGEFEFSHFSGDALSGASVGVEAKNDALSHADAHTIVVPDAHLLFSGDYKRAGVDLVLSKDGHDYVVSDYFRGISRATLSSPDGANLSGDLVNALTGEVQVAQLGGGATAAATVIGRVTKLTGSATAIRNGVSIQLNMGDNVQKGDVVQAGADSSLGLTFIDGTVFGLSANARMVLNEMVYDPNGSSNSSLLSLVQGTITFVAGETAKHGDMKVDTPVATMGIRGTAVLVEIGFEVPGQGGAPPVKFQVLVERGGRVGSYVLYSKTGSILGTVNQAGQVTSVLGNGDATTGQAPPLTQLAQDIITYTFEQFLLNNPNPRSNGPLGSTPGNPVPGSSNPDFPQFHQQDLVPGQSIAPIKFNFQGDTPGTPSITVTVTVTVNTPPTIVVTPIVVTLPIDKTSFNLADQVKITDPDSANPAFNDVATPYVAGTGKIVAALGPSNTPPGIDLAKLVTIDPLTGHVTYDPAAFKFLGEGQKAVFTIGFDSQSGPDTVHETLTFTVDGANDAPAVAAALTVPVHEGDSAITTNLLTGASDPDAGETATLSVANVRYAIDGLAASTTAPAGLTLAGAVLSVDPANPAFAHLAQGETTTIVVSYDVTDAHGATITQTETVIITGTNDAPVVAAGTVASGAINAALPTTTGGLTPGAALILAAGPGLISGIGTATGYGNLALGAGDDNSSGAIDIKSVFGAAGINFFGTSYTSLYINNNGNITFSYPLSAYTPTAIDAGFNNPIIAPFWADVDTRGTGAVYYTLDAADGVMTITWDHVGYYSQGTDKTDSFQLVLINEGNGNFDIVYRYAQIQWTTGSASGGSDGLGGAAARAGYSAGDGVHYYELPQSGNQSALLALPATPGNTGVPGVDGLQVRNGVVGPTTLTTTGTINFSDADLSDTHSIQSVTYTGHGIELGTLALVLVADTTGTGANGQFAWTYTADPATVAAALHNTDTGTKIETFDVVVSDGHGGTFTQTVSITLTGPADQAPVAVPDAISVQAGDLESHGHLLANDTDADHDTLSVSYVAQGVDHNTTFTVEGTYGELVVTKADGSYTYTIGVTAEQANAYKALAAGTSAMDSFKYKASDGHLQSNLADFKITVTGTNHAPTINAAATTATGTITKATNTTGNTGTDSVSGTIVFADADLADTHTATRGSPTFIWSGGTLTAAQIAALSAAGSLDAIASDGTHSVAWTYKIPDSALNFLLPSENLKVQYDVTIADGGLSVIEPVTVSISAQPQWSNPPPNPPQGYDDHATVSASSPTIIPVLSNDTGNGIYIYETLAYPYNCYHFAGSSSEGAALTSFGNFYLYDPTTSNLFMSLAFGETATDHFAYGLADSSGHVSWANVTVTVTGADHVSLTTENDTIHNSHTTVVSAGAGTLGPLDSLTGSGSDTLLLNGSGTFDLAGIAHFSGFEDIVVHDSNADLQIDSTDTAGVYYIQGTGRNLTLTTDAQVLDLSHTIVKGFAISGTNASGTTFIVEDSGTAGAITGGSGPVTIQVAANSGAGVTLTAPSAGATLIGGVVNDTLVSAQNNVTMTGGAGSDTFRFSANFGHDTILDFKHSENDHIDLTAVVTTNDLNAWMASHVAASPTGAADTLITLDGGDTILLHNVAHTSLSASDFIVHPYSV
jgi:VCBS repeat-containing protein